ncbi:MAG: phosphocholine cytidylyltransferase family protein [Bdellovibrionales bacterium]|nr:phosphocholine cytidylyltransferase family protein [Bdellovibrionales bacterium]
MYNVAVIVAAGLSSRLYPHTLDYPKCLLEINHVSLIERAMQNLEANGIRQCFIVTGYQWKKLSHLSSRKGPLKVSLIHNPFYRTCNNMASLWFAKTYVGDQSFIYLHSDVYCDPKLFKHFVKRSEQENTSLMTLMTDFGPVDEEAMKVKVNENDVLVDCNKTMHLDEANGEWTGIAAIHKPQKVFDEIERCLEGEYLDVYDTFAFTNLAAKKHERIVCLSTDAFNWKEIDTYEDLQDIRRSIETAK